MMKMKLLTLSPVIILNLLVSIAFAQPPYVCAPNVSCKCPQTSDGESLKSLDMYDFNPAVPTSTSMIVCMYNQDTFNIYRLGNDQTGKDNIQLSGDNWQIQYGLEHCTPTNHDPATCQFSCIDGCVPIGPDNTQLRHTEKNS